MADDFYAISSLVYAPSMPFASSAVPSTYPSPGSPYYLLPLHHHRLGSAVLTFQWQAAFFAMLQAPPESLGDVMDQSITDKGMAHRIRILLDQRGNLSVEATPLIDFDPASQSSVYILPHIENPLTSFSHMLRALPADAPRWTVVLDSQPITPSNLTSHKTTRRDVYNAARARTEIQSGEMKEVLLWNTSGQVMDGSITTVYFRRRQPGGDGELQDDWMTPDLSCGGSDGVTGRYAYVAGVCVHEEIDVDDLIEHEEVWLSNGVRGFMPGILALNRRRMLDSE